MTLRPAGRQAGFTIVEMIVGTTLGVIVVLGALAVLDTNWLGGLRVHDRVDVDSRGRVQMEQLTRQLRSQFCLGPGAPPISQANNDSLTFYSTLGDENATPEKRQIVFDPAAGTIVESLYAGTGRPPNVTFTPSPTRTRALASNVSAASGVPVFRYYGWTIANPASPTLQLLTPLSVADMGKVVRVGVSFVARSTHPASPRAAQSTFQNSVYVRYASPTDPVKGAQC